MIASGPRADLDAIAAVSAAILDADNRADADAFLAHLADDVVIMAAGLPTLSGREACGAFIRKVLACYPMRHLTIELDERVVSGDLAYERGSYVQMVHDPDEGGPVYERGRGLWTYVRTAGGWKGSRVVFMADGEGT